jgi:hypothetical protein
MQTEFQFTCSEFQVASSKRWAVAFVNTKYGSSKITRYVSDDASEVELVAAKISKISQGEVHGCIHLFMMWIRNPCYLQFITGAQRSLRSRGQRNLQSDCWT